MLSIDLQVIGPINASTFIVTNFHFYITMLIHAKYSCISISDSSDKFRYLNLHFTWLFLILQTNFDILIYISQGYF